MENYRLIEIEDELEDDEEFEEDEDYEDGEFEETLIPEGIILPVNLDLIDELEIDDDDDYEDEDEDDDYEDYEEEDNYYEDEELEEFIPVEMASPRASTSISDGRNLNHFELRGVSDVNGRNEELNRGEIDGLICPICFEAWTSSGEHQICCLPCGHIYGLCCIKKWLQQRRSSGKCPQCNKLCTLKDVRVLYVNGLCVADEELHKST